MVSRKCSARVVVSAIVMGVVLLTGPRNSMAQGLWSAPVTVASGGQPRVAIDAGGNAVAVWFGANGSASMVRAARFTAATGAWSPPSDIATSSGDTYAGFDLAMDAEGNAVAVWGDSNRIVSVVQAVRYSAGSDTWSGTTSLSGAGQLAALPDVSVDSSGNAVVVWRRLADGVVQTARYAAATGVWGGSTDLSAPGEANYNAPAVAVNINGDAVAVWDRLAAGETVVQAARYNRSLQSWSPATTLSAPGAHALTPAVAIDNTGNATAVWHRVFPDVDTFSIVETARLSASTGSWSQSENLSGPGTRHTNDAQVAMDGSGNAIAIWARNDALKTARYSAALAAWSPPLDLSASAGNRVVLSPRVSFDNRGNAVAAWSRYIGGIRGYAAHSSSYVAASAAWTGITDLDSASFNAAGPEVAINGSGAVVAVWHEGQLSAISVRASRAVVPGTPSLQPANVNRPDVTLTWTPPTSGPAPSAYTVVASLSPDGPLVATLPVEMQTSVQVPAPDGTYYVRVVATVAGITVPSNQIAVVIGPTPVPTAPLALGATVTGSTIILAWNAPANASIAPVQTYVIEAGTAAGLANLANFATGSAATSFLTPPVPDGSYYVRLRGRNATGTGPPTSDLRVVVGPPPPGPPVLTGSVGVGASVSLAWTAPTTGALVTGYQLQAGTAPGLVNAAVRSLPTTPLAFETVGVPAGTYYVRVVATSAIGLGFVSNELVLVIP